MMMPSTAGRAQRFPLLTLFTAYRHGRGLVLALLLSACASLPPPGNKVFSTAIAKPEQTALGHIVTQSLGTTPVSGFRLESSGQQALEDRLALIDHAERSLDLQYFMIGHDDTVLALMRHLHTAAERGVRVRLLVDDINTVGRDSALRRFAAHPNIEVRLFNPFAGDRSSMVSRFLTSGPDVQQLSHRMHNKLFIADNAIAITGGRNLGDQYFLFSTSNNFVDLDVIAAGTIVPQLSAMFDRYWNDDHAYPVQSIVSSAEDDNVKPVTPLVPTQPHSDSFSAQLEHGHVTLAIAQATLLADTPGKIDGNSQPAALQPTVATDVASVMASTQHDLTIITPYLVPGAQTMALFGSLTARGVHIRILTNSLASTDAPLAQMAYTQHRPALLRLGVELYELKPLIGPAQHLRAFGSSHAALHAKTFVVDGHTLFVGSMNLDLRSALENTEMGLLMDSPTLSQQMEQMFDLVSREASYRVELQADGNLRWSAASQTGPPQSWNSDPEASSWLKFKLWLVEPFVPETQL